MQAERWVTQTRFGGPDAPPHERGNCFGACLASLLCVSLDEFTPISEVHPDHYWEKAVSIVARYGVSIVPCYLELLAEGTLCEAHGKSPRGDWLHSVVWRAGYGMVHDPHPSRDGLAEAPETGTVLVPLDPMEVRRAE